MKGLMSMRTVKSAAAALAAIGLAMAASGCGSGPESPAVADAGSTTTNSSSPLSPSGGAGTSSGTGGGGSFTMAGGSADAMRKFSSCMRSHGVPNFPDPSADGSITFNGINTQSPSFESAQKACEKYMRGGGRPPSPAEQAAAQAQALKFSSCMRSHGVPKFPDPQFSGGRASLQIGPSTGINPGSPVFQAAQKACQKDLPGRLGTQKGAP
jgi:hypothetical protein